MTSAGCAGLTPGCVTGVGSLPFADPEEAVEFVAGHCAELPFWPQLPRRRAGQGVVGQGVGPLIECLEPSARPYCWSVRPGAEAAFAAGLDHGEARLDRGTAAGFFALEAAIRAGRFPRARAVKAQTEGPATLAHCLSLGEEPLARIPAWLDRLTGYLERQAAWQVRALKATGLPVVFVVDEPVLSLARAGEPTPGAPAMSAAIRRVLDAARRAGAVAGLHCCAPLPLGLLAQLDLDLLSFDAHLPVDRPGFAELARRIARRGGYLAFGLAPTGPPSPSTAIAASIARWLALASLPGDPAAMAGRSLVSATCGLGLSTPDEAAASFEIARQIGAEVGRYADV